MGPTIAVVAVTDSFSEVWPRLIESCGASCLVADSPAGLRELSMPCAVIVAGAGDEAGSLRVVQELASGGFGEIAVVGVERDYWVIRPLLQAGAADFFTFPVALSELRVWLQERVAAVSPAAVRETGADAAFSGLVGDSRAFAEVLASAQTLSESGAATILITGETGTGKDVLAQAIHDRSPRRAGPFVEVNCAALPANLLEAELFGYEKGAFTDARVAKIGLMEAAEGGTLFLDEIGDLPLELQGKLLRVLETKRTRRLGGLRELNVDVRFVAATHVDLGERVRSRRFREDLFYRLDVLSLHLPPLRDRSADSLLLARHFAAEFAAVYGVALLPLSPPVTAAILSHAWPGNVRQLRNAVERAVILGRGEITLENLRLRPEPAASAGSPLPFPASLDQIARAAAHAAVAACVGNKSRAAGLLGISRKGLYALLRGTATPEVPT